MGGASLRWMNPRKTALCPLSAAHSYQEEKRVSKAVLRFTHQNPFQFQNSPIRTYFCRTSVVVQWLRLQASSTGGTGLIPGQGRSHMPHGVAEQNNNKTKQNSLLWKRSTKRERTDWDRGASSMQEEATGMGRGCPLRVTSPHVPFLILFWLPRILSSTFHLHPLHSSSKTQVRFDLLQKPSVNPQNVTLLWIHISQSTHLSARNIFFFFFGVIIIVSIQVTYFSCQILDKISDKWLSFANYFVLYLWLQFFPYRRDLYDRSLQIKV